MLINCSCCREPRAIEATATLQCHDNIRVCRACIGWLAQQAGMLDVTPTLPVVDINAAVGFYETAGFVVHHYDAGFAFVRHGEESVFDLGLEENIDPQRNGAGCYIIVSRCRRVACPDHERRPERHRGRNATVGYARVHDHRPERERHPHRHEHLTRASRAATGIPKRLKKCRERPEGTYTPPGS